MSGFQPGERLDAWRWLGVPIAACILGMLVVAMPIRIAGLRLPEPIFAMVPAFAWGVIRPSIMPALLLLVLGLLVDLLTGGPVGLWALCLLIAYGSVFVSRPMMAGQSRLMMWIWYIAVSGLAFGAAYLLTMLDSLSTPNIFAVGWQFLATAVLYPFAHKLIEQFEDSDVRFR
jgi:rod shape-determining protein MreD